jgi:hypothetical protein
MWIKLERLSDCHREPPCLVLECFTSCAVASPRLDQPGRPLVMDGRDTVQAKLVELGLFQPDASGEN